MWTCPDCGRRLRVRNQEHTCARYALEGHFENRDPLARTAFAWILDTLDDPAIEVLSLKTFIAFQARANFAFIRTKRKGVELTLVLSHPVAHRTLIKSDPYGSAKSLFRFRIEQEDDLDQELETLLQEAYRQGS